MCRSDEEKRLKPSCVYWYYKESCLSTSCNEFFSSLFLSVFGTPPLLGTSAWSLFPEKSLKWWIQIRSVCQSCTNWYVSHIYCQCSSTLTQLLCVSSEKVYTVNSHPLNNNMQLSIKCVYRHDKDMLRLCIYCLLIIFDVALQSFSYRNVLDVWIIKSSIRRFLERRRESTIDLSELHHGTCFLCFPFHHFQYTPSLSACDSCNCDC